MADNILGKSLACQNKCKNAYLKLSPEPTAIQTTFLTYFPGWKRECKALEKKREDSKNVSLPT